MNVDLTQFHPVFFEETVEHLDTLERELLSLAPGAPSAEAIDALFRAAHSIKGGSATFGFVDLAETAHLLENSLHRARRGQLALTPPLVDAALCAVDLLRRQLAAHRGQGETDPLALATLADRLHRAENPPPPEPENILAATTPPAAQAKTLNISYQPSSAAPQALDALLNTLLDLGTLDILESGGPSGRWLFALSCDMPAEALTKRLQTIIPPAQLVIEIPASDGGDAQAAADYGFFPGAPGAPDTSKAPAPLAPNAGLTTVLPLRSSPSIGSDVAPGLESGSIRVSVPKVDLLLNLMSELVINQAMIAQAAQGLDPSRHARLWLGIEQFERHTRALQEAVMSLRLVPIGFVFSRFPRVVRDLAQTLGKEVRLETRGEATELDRGLIEKISDPLTHLLRNSLDHGIEPAALRHAAGKDPVGTIKLEAYHRGGHMVIEISDDGAGLDRQRILAKAREKGLPASDTLSDEEVWQLIFAPGFSTARAITEVSGRGVGMDVVQKNVHALGGRIDLESQPGQGTTVRLHLPLTLAIVDGMAVAVGDELYVLPLSVVIESLQPMASDLRRVAGHGRLVQVREAFLPLLVLHELLDIVPRHADPSQGIVVVVDCDGRRIALQVDELVTQQQFVIKNLERNYRRVPGMAGATILGDGRVALILDPAGLVRRQGQRLQEAA